MKWRFGSGAGRNRGKRERANGTPLPLCGWDEHRHLISGIGLLDDSQLETLNALLSWQCFTVDEQGRRFGNAAWSGKRDTPQTIPDPRIEMLDARLGLRGKHVLEFGCFEGVHTVALAQRAARVTAVDGRVENVVKTLVRLGFYGETARVFLLDLEGAPKKEALDLLHCDILHHVGVLYHLHDPVRHILSLGSFVRQAVMIDTHIATKQSVSSRLEVDGRHFAVQNFAEGGHRDPFSGMRPSANWLLLDTIVQLLEESGFESVEIIEERAERNGPRVLILAQKN